MLNKLEELRKNKESGFTIIEVMIVLAIAGLILLIVLLAVPALQRNSRNTQIKNDAANIVGAISTFVTDNDGAIPTGIDPPDSEGVVKIYKGTSYAVATAKSTAKIQAGTAIEEATGVPTTAPDPGKLVYVVKRSCDSTSTVNRSIAIYYSVETSGAPQLKCVNS